MTVSSTTSRADYVGSGTVGPFSYSFRIMAATDLEVTTATTAGLETTLSYPADFSVSGVGNSGGGSVTLTTALTSGYALTIRRVLPLLQSTSIRNQGTYFPATIEDMNDRTIMIAQQLSEVDSRAMTLAVTSDPTIVSPLLPDPVGNGVLGWNANGTAIVNSTISTGSIAVPGAGRTVSTATAFLANNAEFNIRDYGALGNDSFDCTTAIQACLNAAGVAGGIVKVSAGTYKVSSQMTLPSNVIVRGEGPGSIIHAPAMGGLVIFNGQGITNTTIDNLQLTGVYGKGVVYYQCTKVAVTTCTISGATSPLVADGFAVGVHAYQCTDVVIENNYLSGNGVRNDVNLTFDICCNGSGSLGYQRYFVRNNRCLSTDVHGNIAGYNLQESEISGNEASGAYTRTLDNSGYGIFMYLATTSTQWSAATNYVVGNLVYLGPTGGNGDHYQCILNNINNTPPNGTYWVLLDHGLRDNIVTGNNIHDCEGLGIYCANGRRSLITNNQIRNVATVMTELALPASGIGINGGSATVSHNRIDGSGGSGITINQNNFPCVVTSNVINGAEGLSGIHLRGDCTDVRVSDNDVQGSTGGGIGSSNVGWLMTSISVLGNRVASSTGSGIFLSVPTNCTVSKNTVTLSGGNGIWLYSGGTNNSVSGNVVIDASQTTPNFYSSIVLSSPQTTVTGNVTGNVLANGAKYGISVDGAAAVGSSITGNIGKNNRTLDFSFATGTVEGGNTNTANTGAFTLGQIAQLPVAGTIGTSIELGNSSTSGSVGTVGSSGDTFVANNAKTVAGSSGLTWHQNNAANKSVLILTRCVAPNDIVEIYTAAIGTADGNFATFWGSPLHSIDPAGRVKVATKQVVSTQGTGFVNQTAVASKADLGAAPTVGQLAAWASAIDAEMKRHGLFTT